MNYESLFLCPLFTKYLLPEWDCVARFQSKLIIYQVMTFWQHDKVWGGLQSLFQSRLLWSFGPRVTHLWIIWKCKNFIRGPPIFADVSNYDSKSKNCRFEFFSFYSKKKKYQGFCAITTNYTLIYSASILTPSLNSLKAYIWFLWGRGSFISLFFSWY